MSTEIQHLLHMESSEEGLHQPILNSTLTSSSSPSPEEHTQAIGSGAHIVDSRLEDVLSDTNLPWLKKLQSATWIELSLLSRIAGPAIFVYLINNFMSTATRAFAGHLGNLEYAAANLGNSGVQLFAYGLMVCPVTSLFYFELIHLPLFLASYTHVSFSGKL